MKRFWTVTALCMGTVAISPAAAAPVASPVYPASTDMYGPSDLVLIKNDKAKKQKKILKKGKKAAENPGKGGGKSGQAPGNGKNKSARDNGKPDKAVGKAAKASRFVARAARTEEERTLLVKALRAARAPDGRNMAPLVGVATLALLDRDVVFGNISDEDLLTYRNCPPGLAKKDPPCVPPGLAKKGVGYDEWVAYDDDDYDTLLEERRRVYYGEDEVWDRDTFPERTSFPLRSDDIARLYDLDPAPDGQRYALIDGLPVLVDATDYDTLARINELARVAELGDTVRVAPTAALSQDELRRLYRLPDPGDGYNYAVLNGDVVRLDDDSYEILQLIRVTRAIL